MTIQQRLKKLEDDIARLDAAEFGPRRIVQHGDADRGESRMDLEDKRFECTEQGMELQTRQFLKAWSSGQAKTLGAINASIIPDKKVK